MFILLSFLAVLGLPCCVRAFSSCGKWGLLSVAVCKLLIVVASLVAEHGSRCMGFIVAACGLSSMGSVVVAQGLSCPMACEIFLDQGLNLCFLHWQANSSGPPGKSEIYLLIVLRKY